MFSFPGLGKAVAWSWALKAFGALSLISALNAGHNQAFRLVTKVGKDQSAGMDSIVYHWLMTWLSKDTSTRTDYVKPEFSKWEPWSQHFLKNKQLRMCTCNDSVRVLLNAEGGLEMFSVLDCVEHVYASISSVIIWANSFLVCFQ